MAFAPTIQGRTTDETEGTDASEDHLRSGFASRLGSCSHAFRRRTAEPPGEGEDDRTLGAGCCEAAKRTPNYKRRTKHSRSHSPFLRAG